MEEYEIEKVLDGKEIPRFKEKLNQMVFLMKFTAIAAKKIMIVSRENEIDAKLLLDGIEEWINKLESEKENA